MFSRQTAQSLSSVVIDMRSICDQIDKPASRGCTNLMAVGTVVSVSASWLLQMPASTWTYNACCISLITAAGVGSFAFQWYHWSVEGHLMLQCGHVCLQGLCTRTDRLCLVCKSLDCVEDEQHFVFDCPAYSHIRSQHLDLLQHCCTIADFTTLCEPNSFGGFLRECFA